jgi:hypothetical protein
LPGAILNQTIAGVTDILGDDLDRKSWVPAHPRADALASRTEPRV